MAEIYTVFYRQISFAGSKNMAMIQNLYNDKTIKILKIGLINNSIAAVSGALCQLEVRAYRNTCSFTDNSSTILFYPFFHDKANTYPEKIICASNGTVSGTSYTLRRVFWSSDETNMSTSTIDELEAVLPLNIVFDSGYNDSNVQPLTLRAGEFVSIYNITGAAGAIDIYIEFELE